MTILEAIQGLCAQIPGYSFRFDDRQMMNVRADDQPFPCIFFEEYRQGGYKVSYFIEKSTRVQLYFMKLCPMHDDGSEREMLREQIEREAVLPFINLFNSAIETFGTVENWRFYTPPPRFDSNEVSVMLEFDAVMTSCL